MSLINLQTNQQLAIIPSESDEMMYAKWMQPANAGRYRTSLNFTYLNYAAPHKYWNPQYTQYNYYDAEIARNLSPRYFVEEDCDGL